MKQAQARVAVVAEETSNRSCSVIMVNGKFTRASRSILGLGILRSADGAAAPLRLEKGIIVSQRHAVLHSQVRGALDTCPFFGVFLPPLLDLRRSSSRISLVAFTSPLRRQIGIVFTPFTSCFGLLPPSFGYLYRVFDMHMITKPLKDYHGHL
jgi:hypothetical protein